jgi:hypothetical protein
MIIMIMTIIITITITITILLLPPGELVLGECAGSDDGDGVQQRGGAGEVGAQGARPGPHRQLGGARVTA